MLDPRPSKAGCWRNQAGVRSVHHGSPPTPGSYSPSCGKPGVRRRGSRGTNFRASGSSGWAPVVHPQAPRGEDPDLQGCARGGAQNRLTVLFDGKEGSSSCLPTATPNKPCRSSIPCSSILWRPSTATQGTVNQVMGDGYSRSSGRRSPTQQAWPCARATPLRRRRLIRIPGRRELGRGRRPRGSTVHMDHSAIGRPTHLAARMEQLAAPGLILLLPGGGAHSSVTPSGPVAVKGLPTPPAASAYQLTGLSRLVVPAPRLRARPRPFVGRETVGSASSIAPRGRHPEKLLVDDDCSEEPGVGRWSSSSSPGRGGHPAGWRGVLDGKAHGVPPRYLIPPARLLGIEAERLRNDHAW